MNFEIIWGYISYLFKSKNLHGIHSPFVYDFVKNIIYKDKNEDFFNEIENLRIKLKKDKSMVEGWDFGKNIKSNKSISQIASQSAKSKKYCRLLYRIAKWKNPKTSVEIGTSLGLSTIYISKAIDKNAKIFSLEGNNAVAEIAESNLEKNNIENSEIISGNFDETLKPLVERQTEIDFVFFDGNHHFSPTLNYFETCLKKASPDAVFVFDDINWSAQMQQAWNEIKKHPSVNLTIDLYFLGIVFLGNRLAKENFVVRF